MQPVPRHTFAAHMSAIAHHAAYDGLCVPDFRWTDTAEGFWTWKNGWRIRYQRSGDSGPALLLVHGFGGNAEHFRKNTAALAAANFRVFAVDLLGYGLSSKPDPTNSAPNTIYNFENWAEQLRDFTAQVVKTPVCVVCNSVGGIAALEFAIRSPELVEGLVLTNISLRMLHVKVRPCLALLYVRSHSSDRRPPITAAHWVHNSSRMPPFREEGVSRNRSRTPFAPVHPQRQNPLSRPLVSAFQTLLRETPLGAAFFSNVARPATVKNILRQAYHDPSTVTDELVDCILTPGLQEGAVSVFLDFISYSGGPLPEDQLEAVERPVVMVWGNKDPWEKVRGEEWSEGTDG